MKSYKYFLGILLYALSVTKGYSNFIEGEHYRRVEVDISHFEFLFERTIDTSIPIVVKLFTLACKPCFEIEKMLLSPEWQDLYQRINILPLHSLRYDLKQKTVSKFDFGTFDIYHVLKSIQNNPETSSMFSADEWHHIYEDLNYFFWPIKNTLGYTYIDISVRGHINSKYPNSDFAKLFSKKLDDISSTNGEEFESIFQNTLDLCKKIGLSSLPGFLVFTKNGTFILERLDLMKSDDEIDKQKMLSALSHIVNTYN